MKKKILAGVLTVVIPFLCLGVMLSIDDAQEKMIPCIEAMRIVQKNYIEEVSADTVVIGGIDGMLASLNDPYTRFITGKEYRAMRDDTKGKFGGLGITITKKEDDLVVISPIENTPAWEKGIKGGDVIVKIDGEPTKDMKLDDAVFRLRGEVGTLVRISVRRDGENQLLEYDIIRREIPITSVKSKMLDKEIAYIKVMSFSENTASELDAELKKMREGGMKAIILDLRRNPGGLLNAAIDVSRKFLKKGSKIVETRGRQDVFGNQPPYIAENYQNPYLDYPMMVMVNHESASASEIVAGALKDNNRARILGTRSFGKGLVQSVITLESEEKRDNALVLTTAKYYTPSGICIQGIGIEPDISVEQQQFTREEAKMYNDLQSGKYLEKFAKEKQKYTREDFSAFIQDLKSRGIKLNRDYIKRRVDEIINKTEYRDRTGEMEEDLQLQKCYGIMKNVLIVTKKTAVDGADASVKKTGNENTGN